MAQKQKGNVQYLNPLLLRAQEGILRHRSFIAFFDKVVTIVVPRLRMFEWDKEKNTLNLEKHGIGFSLAVRIFDGPVLTWIDDRNDYAETRYHSIGQIDGLVVLAVIHTDRAGKTRLISARAANRRERRRYDEEVRKRVDP
ncbi:BrnT family toxin [Agrobacterium rosae]|uniref:BrnT family toxin n=1 Tax=Agrobacterium rosae TaxID=1972867 RepID=UPI002A10DFF0|nr:BrnT family toxin [Agrobacterium rosae]MDX8316635.1 BrnT family toxin [Agrobacterium rosae]